METRKTVATVPTGPIAFALAVLAVLALGLAAWYTLASGASLNSGASQTVIGGGAYESRGHGTDAYSPRDPMAAQKPAANSDPYSPHDH